MFTVLELVEGVERVASRHDKLDAAIARAQWAARFGFDCEITGPDYFGVVYRYSVDVLPNYFARSL